MASWRALFAALAAVAQTTAALRFDGLAAATAARRGAADASVAPVPTDLATPLTRHSFVGAVASGVLALATPRPATAYQGIYGMEIISAQDAVLDEEALANKDVQAAVTDFRKLAKSVKALTESVNADAQYDLAPVIRKEFDPVRVRTTLNNLNPLFDKDTQYGTDRLQRGILQDLVEIDINSKLTPGKPRSAKKLAAVTEKLKKLDATFDKLEAYLAGA